MPLVAPMDPVLELEPDDGLVTYMALKDEDPDLAMRACTELHRRHSRFLMGWCLNNRAETFGDAAEDFVNLAFIKAYEKAESFQCPSNLDPALKRRKVVAWLFRILKNSFFDARDKEGSEPVFRTDDDEDGLRLEAPGTNVIQLPSQVSPERKNLVLKFIQSLELVDQAILKVTAECWSPSLRKTVIADDVREKICREFGLTENSLRVRRNRALERLRNFILENETKTKDGNEKNTEQRK
jgi:DNA-directed RNA polymerase specialized sigma24 family protein